MGVAQGTELIWSAFRVGSEFLASRAVNRAKEFPMPDLVHDLGALIRRTEEDEAAQVLDFVLPKIVPEDDAADGMGDEMDLLGIFELGRPEELAESQEVYWKTRSGLAWN